MNEGKPQDYILDQVMSGVEPKRIPLKYIVEGFISSSLGAGDTQISKELLFLLLQGETEELSEDELETIRLSDPSTSYLAATLNHKLVFADAKETVNQLIERHFRK